MDTPARSFPTADELDRLTAEACRAELAPLFEGAPRFLDRLVAARPFASDEGLIAAAFEVAHGLPDDEAVELVNAHPRIGADPATVSDMSRAEQGFGGPESGAERSAPATGEPVEGADEVRLESSWVDEELAGLNDVYEHHFGFRYAVFVAGRPRSAIVPLMEMALRNDRIVELRRGVDDCVRIAADRLLGLRGGPPPEPEEWA